jgi:hypothetical protein
MGKYPFDKPKFWEKKPSKDPKPFYPCSCNQPYIDNFKGTIEDLVESTDFVGHVSYKKMPCEEIKRYTREEIENLDKITFTEKAYLFKWSTMIFDNCILRQKAKEKNRIDAIPYEELPMHLNEIDTSCIPDYFISKFNRKENK